MRGRYLSFDAWLCLALAVLLALGTGKLASLISQNAYQEVKEEHLAEENEVGGKASEEIFRAQSVEDLLSHETFTVISPGIEYRNRGGGYLGGKYLQALTLPSGELVAAHINADAIQELGDDFMTSDKILPVGRLVWQDLTKDTSFIGQIEHAEPLSRTDFYIDMAGGTVTVAKGDVRETVKTVTQVITVIVAFPLLHMAGSKLGIFPQWFSFRKKKEEENP